MTTYMTNVTAPGVKSLEAALEQLRTGIQVAPEELDEARRRRTLVSAALRKEFADCEVYVNGSVAHGDALTPLTDIDLGVIVLGGCGRLRPGG